jgi:hypothetical protein
MANATNFLTFVRRQPRWRFALVLVVAAAGFYFFRHHGPTAGQGITFAARHGPLDITVLEGGSIQALESQEIKCEVRVGYQGLKILKIVEEGYQVTEEDIHTNKVLVELDSSDLRKQLAQQEIQYQSAAASLTDGQQGYDIQLNQNLSDIKAAEQKARFARMDFAKFLGGEVADTVINRLEVDKELEAEETNSRPAAVPAPETPVSTGAAAPADPTLPAGAVRVAVVTAADGPADPPPAAVTLPAQPAAPSPAPAAVPPPPKPAPAATNALTVDFMQFASIEKLGNGEAKQKLRDLEDTLQVSKKEEGQAESTAAGTKRLFEKGFVTKIDQERDDIAAENARLKVQKADTARDLYLKYEFSKTGEENLSKYVEAVRELNRARKAAVSKLAQAEARLRSAQGQYDVQLQQRNEMKDQLGKCIITAKKPGLVVYGGGGDEMFFYGDQERIREGGTVRERQSIITIPDMTKMSVKVKIHESYIKKVKKGEKARVTIDAFPDEKLDGEVTKVGVLPDSQNRWMNPDLKVYLTTITINGSSAWIKPGMSAKVEILVDRLPEVIYVPVQAVAPHEGKQVCYLPGRVKPELREVEVGQFNDEFIEIKKGLKEGDKVLLRPPVANESEEGETGKAPAGIPAEKPKTTPAQPAKATPARKA